MPPLLYCCESVFVGLLESRKLLVQFCILKGRCDYRIHSFESQAEVSTSLLLGEQQVVPACVINGLEVGHVELNTA